MTLRLSGFLFLRVDASIPIFVEFCDHGLLLVRQIRPTGGYFRFALFAVLIGVILPVESLEELLAGLIGGFLLFRIELTILVHIEAFEQFCAFVSVLAGFSKETFSGVE